jgi:UDP-2,3-diacylglucosamine hydrolase
MVIVLGDLFDFYHGYDRYIYPWYRSAADSLKILAERGKRVIFLEGNHEFRMGAYFEAYTGAECTREISLDIDGRKVFVAHGDAFARLSLANILKRPFFYKIMDILGPAITWGIAAMMRPLISRKRKEYSDTVRDIFRSYAMIKFSEGYDVVVLAHSHIPDVLEINEGSVAKKYLNTGDLAQYASYVVYQSSSGFSLKTCGSTENQLTSPL